MTLEQRKDFMVMYAHKIQKLIARLQNIEQELVAQFSSKTVVENALLLGTPSQMELLHSCASLHRHYLGENYYDAKPSNIQACVGHFTDIPYQSESMDFIILPHVLEFAGQAQRMIEQAAECLSQRGTLLLFASSNISLSNSKRLLSNAGLTVIEARSFFSMFSYFPENKCMRFLDKSLTPYLPLFSHAYFILAKKLITPATLMPVPSRAPVKLALALQSRCATRVGRSSEC
jgi:hypothetical protein